ncbi:MAG TPA: hypothetical protein VLQ45_01295 [Thermoanaerobaculia bacterium]|nr:hypothetical protein [Thermoanaerobaculia bacterium]
MAKRADHKTSQEDSSTVETEQERRDRNTHLLLTAWKELLESRRQQGKRSVEYSTPKP